MNNKIKIAFNEEAHRYTLNGRVVPSVTQVMKETIGVAWLADEFYLQRGRAVHACAKMLVEGIPFESDPRIAGQVEAIRKFLAEHPMQVEKCEEPVASNIYQFAGTPDLVGVFNGMRVCFDWKSSLDEKRVAVQIGGYSIAYKETFFFEVAAGMGVELHDDGTYKATDLFSLKRARNDFLACRAVYGLKEKMGSIKT